MQKHYFCGKELLRFDGERSVIYTVLVFDLDEACLARVWSDGEIEKLFADQSLVPHKMKPGGMSANRFQHGRDDAIKEWFKKLNEVLMRVDAERVVVGCSSIYFKRFFDGLHSYNRAKIGEQRTIEYSGLTGVYQLVKALEAEKGASLV